VAEVAGCLVDEELVKQSREQIQKATEETVKAREGQYVLRRTAAVYNMDVYITIHNTYMM
jgi:hypothetical protein